MPETERLQMKTANAPVEPYRYFWLHMHPPNKTSSLLSEYWGKPDDNNNYYDGDHFFGLIREYCIGDNGDLLVITEPLWKIASDDGPLKWHQIKKYPQSIMKFEGCVDAGVKGKSLRRLKTPSELVILSSSEHDRELIAELVDGNL